MKKRVVEARRLLGDQPPSVHTSPAGAMAVFWGRKTKWLPPGSAWQVAQDPKLSVTYSIGASACYQGCMAVESASLGTHASSL